MKCDLVLPEIQGRALPRPAGGSRLRPHASSVRGGARKRGTSPDVGDLDGVLKCNIVSQSGAPRDAKPRGSWSEGNAGLRPASATAACVDSAGEAQSKPRRAARPRQSVGAKPEPLFNGGIVGATAPGSQGEIRCGGSGAGSDARPSLPQPSLTPRPPDSAPPDRRRGQPPLQRRSRDVVDSQPRHGTMELVVSDAPLPPIELTTDRSSSDVLSASVPVIGQLSGAGIAEALKQAFLDRFGSLEAAFDWIDFNNRGRLSRTNWETGMKIFPLPDPLKQMKNGKIFATMSRKGEITRQVWREFFDYVPEAAEDDGEADELMVNKQFRGSKGAKMLDRLLLLAGGFSKTGKRMAQDLDSLRFSSDEMPSLQRIFDVVAIEEDGVLFTLDSQSIHGKVRDAEMALVASDNDHAEALQLEDDIRQSNYKGKQALAYILAAKFGSLDKAFKWFDCTSNGCFARVQWDTGLLVMHVNVAELTGLQPRDIFLMMGGQKGRVTKKKWDRFFNSVDVDYESLRDVQPAFKKRARKKLVQMWRSAPRDAATKGGRSDAGRQDRSDESVVASGATVAARAGRAGGESALGPSGETDSRSSRGSRREDSAKPRSSSNGVGNGSVKRTPSRGMSTDPSRVSAPERGPSKDVTADGDEGYRAPSCSQRASSKEPSPELLKDDSLKNKSFEEAPGSVDKKRTLEKTPHSVDQVEESSEAKSGETKDSNTPELSSAELFRQQLREELLALGPDEGREFRNLRRTERVILEELARELGLWWSAQGGGVQIFREGPEGTRIKQQLEGLRSGEIARYQSLQPIMRLFARSVAEGRGHHVETRATEGDVEDGPLFVMNLGGSLEEFSNGVRGMLLKLAPGEVVDFPAVLSESQREAIHAVAEELCLLSGIFTKAEGAYIAVGNLGAFQQMVRRDLKNIEPGATASYGREHLKELEAGGSVEANNVDTLDQAALPQLVREIVDNIAGTLGFRVCSGEDHRGAPVLVVQQKEAQNAADGQELPDAGDGQDLDDEAAKELSRRMFHEYATGKTGNNVFLRKFDLNRFVADVCTLREKLREEKTLQEIERIFDDTLELQVDMGSRFMNGITYDYFEVFLSKSARVFGWSLTSLLKELTNFYT